METKAIEKIVLEYPDVETTEPEELISFSEEYLRNIPSFMREIEKKVGENMTINFARIQQNGDVAKKIMTGKIKEVIDENFIFHTNQSPSDGSVYENGIDILIRTDNVLGLIPLPQNLNPFEGLSTKAKNYLHWLGNTKQFMWKYLYEKHSAYFHWKYSKHKNNFRLGKYQTEGKILEVNYSNIKYYHLRTISFVPESVEGGSCYIDIVPRKENDRFIAPDRYLWRVEILLGIESKINPHDEE